MYCFQRGWPYNARSDAESGDVQAQLYLATQYFNSSQPAKTLRWYKKAAAQGNPEAMANLAELYLSGKGGAKLKLVKSCEWMEKYLTSDSIEKEPDTIKKILHEYGVFLLGARTSVMVQPQQELPIEMRDAKKACQLLERAGNEFNCMDSIKMLGGGLYMTGQHPQVPRDYDKGMYWFMKGAQNGDGQSAFQLAMTYKCGLIPVNRELEAKWLQIADKLGYHEAKQMLSIEKKQLLSKGEARKRLKELNKEKNITEYLTTDETRACSNPHCNNVEKGNKHFSFCTRCKHTKYCSKQCQTIHWKKGGHKEECSLLEKNKEILKENNRNSVLPEAKICFNPDCCKKEKKDSKLLRCSRCKTARYCSRECQLAHFRGGHKKVCKQVFDYMEEANKLLEKLG